MPKIRPWIGSIRPSTIGRDEVRDMRASILRSMKWLIAPAPPAER